MSSFPNTTRPRPQLSERSAASESSVVREFLSHAKRPGMISLAGGLPDASHFPTQELAAIAHHVIATAGQDVLQYGLSAGEERARLAMASLFPDGTNADQLVVTTGSQQGLDLIARVLLDPGDQIIVGDPDYLGALQVFRSSRADLRPIAIDADGLNTVQLEEQLSKGLRPKACYLVPNFHNPTGVTMSAQRRRHLDDLSQKYGFLVIEDDPYRELFFGGQRPRDAESDPELTVQLRSTSKVLAPSLRVGALRGPDWLTDAIVTAKQAADLHTSSLTQAIAAEALSASWFPEHLESLRALYRSKRDILTAALRAEFHPTVDFVTPAGGMFVLARFTHVRDTEVWLRHALQEGVCFVPGQAFAVHRDLSGYARLSFATGSADALRVAVVRMARATVA